ncbi:hypothetical protein LPIBR_10354 [Lacticaseibacillus paracasei]|nr:hypothetical protein LPIBR_10354 [Lacticaseibacillus paracasei]
MSETYDHLMWYLPAEHDKTQAEREQARLETGT